jgi:hypothetical protein
MLMSLSRRQTRQIGMKMVAKLSERYYNSDRCICADNFFTSVPLCEFLWSKNLEYLGNLFHSF